MTPFDCQFFLQNAGYPLTPNKVNACAESAEWLCYYILIWDGVTEHDATAACELAQVD